MSNPYYNFLDPATAGTIVDPFDYNREMEAITDAFSVVPPASQLASGTLNYSSDAGSGNNHVASLDAFDDTYQMGSNVAIRIASNSTGPSTLDVNNIGVKDVTLPVFGDVTNGDLFANGIYTFVYNGDKFQCLEMGQRYYTVAGAKEVEAIASRDAAAASVTTTATKAANALTSAGQANTSNSATTTSRNAATASATTAKTNETNAKTSETNAANSQSSAATNATTATTRATAATNSATAATNSATAAASSATAAASSATAANNSKTSAANSAATAAALPTSPTFNSRVLAIILEIEKPVGVVEFFDRDLNPNTMYPGTTWLRLPESVSLRIANDTGSDVYTQTGSDSFAITATQMPSHNHSVTPGTVSSTDVGSKTLASVDLGTKTLASFDQAAVNSNSPDLGTKTLASLDLGSKTTGGGGSHSHTISQGNNADVSSGRAAASNSGQTATTSTASVGDHSHSVAIGSHSHSVVMGAHSHTYVLGSHSHNVAVGSHTHNVVMGSHGHTASVSVANTGSGTAISVIESSLILVAWYRSA